MLPNNGALLMLGAEPDLRILLFSVAVALATGILFGLTLGLQGTKLDIFTTLKDVVGAVAGSGNSARLRKTLVTVQVALSFPGVQSAAYTIVPLLHGSEQDTSVSVEDYPTKDGEDMLASRRAGFR